jgi:hypothetical protein
MTGRPAPTDDEVLRRLQSHADALRRESYPGDLVADVRPRLAVPKPRRAVPAAALLVATAASLLMAVWLARDPVRPERTALTGLPPPPRMPSTVPSLSTPVPSMGAVTLGAGAVGRVRPPAAAPESARTSRRSE